MRKIGFDCLVIVFTATVMVIKTTKIAHFCFFVWMTAKRY